MRPEEFEEALFSQSIRLRAGRKPARRWLKLIVAKWDTNGFDDKRIRTQAIADYRETYGSPILVLWALSIVINLLFKWWLNRDRADTEQIVRDYRASADAS